MSGFILYDVNLDKHFHIKKNMLHRFSELLFVVLHEWSRFCA